MTSNQENQMTAKWRSRALALALSLGACLPAFAQNAIQSINSSQQAGAEVVRVEMAEQLAAVPAGFSIQTPPRVAIDLIDQNFFGGEMGCTLGLTSRRCCSIHWLSSC